MNERRALGRPECAKIKGYRGDVAAAKLGARTDRKVTLAIQADDKDQIVFQKGITTR
jgi:hypothetical protein